MYQTFKIVSRTLNIDIDVDIHKYHQDEEHLKEILLNDIHEDLSREFPIYKKGMLYLYKSDFDENIYFLEFTPEGDFFMKLQNGSIKCNNRILFEDLYNRDILKRLLEYALNKNNNRLILELLYINKKFFYDKEISDLIFEYTNIPIIKYIIEISDLIFEYTNIPIIKYIIDIGIDLNNLELKFGRKPIHVFFENGNTEIIEYLIHNHNINFNIIDRYGDTPIALCFYAASFFINPDFYIKNRKKLNFDLNVLNKRYGETAFHITCLNRHINSIKYILDNNYRLNIDLNKIDNEGKNAFYKLCYFEKIRHVQDIREHILLFVKYSQLFDGNFFDRPNNKGDTSLNNLIKFTDSKHIEIFIKNIDINFNYINRDGNTYFHEVCKFSKIDILKLFIENKHLFDISKILHIKNNKGYTPLDIALRNNNKDIVKLIKNIS